MRELERLMTIHGPPGFIRSDNGPEFIADAARGFLAASGVRTDTVGEVENMAQERSPSLHQIASKGRGPS